MLPYHPFRDNISSINFDKSAACRDILLLDKTTRIEGLCSEAVFMEDIVKDNFSPVATDFWFTHAPNSTKYDVLKLVIHPERPLNDLDYLLLDKWVDAPEVGKTGIVYFDASKNEFWVFPHSRGSHYDQLLGKGVQWPLPGDGQMAKKEEIIREHTIDACDFLDARGLLRENAIKRTFANCFLTKRGHWDVDAFTVVGSTLIAFEVKHKYPAKGKKNGGPKEPFYGINTGQKALFDSLEGMGIKGIYAILKKPVSERGKSAIEQLTKPDYISKTLWVYGRLDSANFRAAPLLAPKYTNLYASGNIEYIPVPCSAFSYLKHLWTEKSGVRDMLLEGLV